MSFTPNPFLAELLALNYWTAWRLEFAPPMKKPTKVPYSSSGWKVNITDKNAWRPYAEVSALPFTCVEPCHPEAPVRDTGFTGVGFIFCNEHEYGGIDLDSEDGQPTPEQLKIYNLFNSYTEYSQSGKGIHILVKGKVPMGRRKAGVEVYSDGRYFAMTGNVLHGVPIAERQELLDTLFEEMGGLTGGSSSGEIVRHANELQAEAFTDEEIYRRASTARNSQLFLALWNGDISGYDGDQSRADDALIQILSFYSKHRNQTRRLFLASALGKRAKAFREDYFNRSFNKSFDLDVNVSSEVVEAGNKALDAMLAKKDAAASEQHGATEPGRSSEPMAAAAAPATPYSATAQGMPLEPGQVNTQSTLPGSLLRQISDYIYYAAPRQVRMYADVGAIALISGNSRRAYNISGTGLNQYFLMLGGTGSGKDAVASGIDRLFSEVKKTVPSAIDFRGADELVSAVGLAKSFVEKPCQLLIVGEVGKKLHEMTLPFANTNVKALSRLLLQFYSKSGHGEKSGAMAYSDRGNNIAAVESPTLTLLGESVPNTVYDNFDDTMVSDGLLPRFLIFEYNGDRQLFNDNRYLEPSLELVNQLANLMATCLSTMSRAEGVNNVPMTQEAAKVFADFDAYTTHLINENRHEGINELWNRAHIKSLKLAAVAAISENMYEPQVSYDNAVWATNLIAQQTGMLAAKFELGDIGNSGTSETKQLKDTMREIILYALKPYNAKFHGTKAMHERRVITQSFLSQRLAPRSAFKHDRLGAGNALKRAIEQLKTADYIVELDATYTKSQFDSEARSFSIRPEGFEAMAATLTDKERAGFGL